MKQTFSILMLLTALGFGAHAQKSATFTGVKQFKTRSPKRSAEGKSKPTTPTPDNRKNYNWKNGQDATPTGQQATGTNTESFTSLKKNAAKPSNLKH